MQLHCECLTKCRKLKSDPLTGRLWLWLRDSLITDCDCEYEYEWHWPECDSVVTERITDSETLKWEGTQMMIDCINSIEETLTIRTQIGEKRDWLIDIKSQNPDYLLSFVRGRISKMINRKVAQLPTPWAIVYNLACSGITYWLTKQSGLANQITTKGTQSRVVSITLRQVGSLFGITQG